MNNKYLQALLLLIFYSSCTVYRQYPIEIYKPAELNIPPDVKNAAVVYRNFKYPGDTLQNFYKEGHQLKKAQTPGSPDSILVSTCMNALASNMKNDNLLKEVSIFPYSTFERHTGDHLPDLSANVITRLADDANAGLLIALETFSSFFSAYPATTETPLTHEAVTVSVWAIYDPEKGRMLARKTLIDTLRWDDLDANGNLLHGYNLPPRITALKLASESAGEAFAGLFHASWQTENRMYSIPPLPDFSEAAFFLEEGRWDEAIGIWKRYAGNRNGKMAIDARYNLALAYEMKDDQETARKWLAEAWKLAKSYRSKSSLQMIELYQKTLDIRQREIIILEQMNHENKP